MRYLFIFTFVFTLVNANFAQKTETPAEKQQRMSWWKDAKFGMFIHWGVYAVAAGSYNGQDNYGEWLMYEAKIPVPEYEKLAPQFNPVRFNANDWVLMAKNAGMKYIVITSKHHDGFAIYNSKVSNYDIVDRTPFKRDPLRELADACRKHGLKLCFYHSIMDWHHPDANKENFARYRDEYMLPQLKELLTNYGDIGVLWFDGEWIDEWTEEQGKALYEYVRTLQPGIIVNNRVGKGRNGMQGMNKSAEAVGDFGTPEQEILSEKSTLDWESCMTMNDHWGYCKADTNYKSANDLIWNLADITAKGGNFLLNIGPTAAGVFPAESVERLRAIGQWMQENSAAIYGTKPWEHWQEGPGVRYTQSAKGDIFAFVRNAPAQLLLKKITPTKGSTITVLGYKKPLQWQLSADGVTIELPQEARRNNTIVLRMQGNSEPVTEAPKFGYPNDKVEKNVVFSKTQTVVMTAEAGATIYYTTNGSAPTTKSAVFTRPFEIKTGMVIRAMALSKGKRSSETVEQTFVKAQYGVESETEYAAQYSANGPLTLVDGQLGSTNFKDGKWLGYEGKNMRIYLDLGYITQVDTLNLSFLRNLGSWIFMPTNIQVYYSSYGSRYQNLPKLNLPAAKATDPTQRETVRVPVNRACRYLMIDAANVGICPAWHPGAGAKSWLFADEVGVKTSALGLDNNYDVLPKPQVVRPLNGVFVVTDSMLAQWPDPGREFADHFYKKQNKPDVEYREEKETSSLKIADKTIQYEFVRDGGTNPEWYSLHIEPHLVRVGAHAGAGFYYANQTLIQLMEGNGGNLPCVQIEDEPRFSWRGMHLDESRHFFGKTFVKQFIDQMASLKMNVFHWHLTDAQGWRIEIKKYPKLTSVGAWRPDRTGFLNSDADTARVGEPMTYGGFYTQDDIREIVAYAAQRNITIIPEIEMPGHCTAALVAYPEYSCTGGPFPMPGGAKNCPYPNFCVGNEATIGFLQDILTEVMTLFPSKYIHIGGDEVERHQWKTCPKCQARKTALGLADEAQLQVNFTKRIEDFLRSQGRNLMGWDEIMEGGNLSSSAGVMVWRGDNLLREATAAGHEVVVTHKYYFNRYQGNPQYEPLSAGYTPLKEVYTEEPLPGDLSAAQTALVRGVEACLWSENLYTTRDVEYMMNPRTLALAEVAWSATADRNWPDFARRLPRYLEGLKQKGIHFSTAIYNPYPEARYDSTARGLVCHIEQQVPTGTIRYTLDGSAPTPESAVYYKPLPLKAAAEIKATAFRDDKPISVTTTLPYRPSLSSGKPFTLKKLPARQYSGDRPETLNDGMTGTSSFHDGNWCGFEGDDIELTIDLGAAENVREITTRWMDANNSWIYLPVTLRVETSEDGKKFVTEKTMNQAEIAAMTISAIKTVKVPVSGHKARYVRIIATNPGTHPVYKEGKCWLFLDEVEVR